MKWIGRKNVPAPGDENGRSKPRGGWMQSADLGSVEPNRVDVGMTRRYDRLPGLHIPQLPSWLLNEPMLSRHGPPLTSLIRNRPCYLPRSHSLSGCRTRQEGALGPEMCMFSSKQIVINTEAHAGGSGVQTDATVVSKRRQRADCRRRAPKSNHTVRDPEMMRARTTEPDPG